MKGWKKALLLPWAGGAATPFTPLSISGLQAWYKADVLVLSNNDPVSSWTDSSGNNRPALQANGTLQPVYKTAQLNELPAVDFDGADDYMQTGAFTLAHPCTVFMVVKQKSFTAGDRLMDGRSAATLIILQQAIGPERVAIRAASTGPLVAFASGSWGLITGVFDSTSSTIALNGGTDVTGTVGAGVSAGGITLAATAAGGQTGDCTIAELLVYNVVLSAGNQALVKAYLNTKYVLY